MGVGGWGLGVGGWGLGVRDSGFGIRGDALGARASGPPGSSYLDTARTLPALSYEFWILDFRFWIFDSERSAGILLRFFCSGDVPIAEALSCRVLAAAPSFTSGHGFIPAARAAAQTGFSLGWKGMALAMP